MPHTDILPLRVVHETQKADHVVKIVQRLADAHQDDVGDIRPRCRCAVIYEEVR